MHTVCPTCKASIGIKQAPPAADINIRCSACRSVFRLVPKKQASLPVANSSLPPSITVVVANEDPSFCSAVSKVLGAGFRLVICHDGPSALAAIERCKPDVALLDVALPRLYGFQVCESVRNNADLASVKLVIIAATYDTRRYTRDSGAMYGADAVIEKHRIAGGLKRLLISLASEAGGADNLPAPEQPSTGPAVDDAGAGTETVRATDQAVPEEHKKAQRLARLIVSDIALYNKPLVEAGVRNGTFYKVLEDDIYEGRALYERRVPAEIRNCTSYLDDAFADLVRKQEQELSKM